MTKEQELILREQVKEGKAKAQQIRADNNHACKMKAKKEAQQLKYSRK